MNTLQKSLYLISVSLGLAILFDYLFFGRAVGISIVVLAGTLLGTVFLFGMHQKLNLRKSWWLALLIICFAFMPGIRDNEFLTFLNVCATFGLLMLLAHQLAGTPVFLMRIVDYILLIILVPFQMLGKAFSTLVSVGQSRGSVKHRDVWVRVVKGVIMAVPVLIIFGALFSQADLAFSKFITGFVDINITERTIQHAVLMAFAFAASLCFLSYIFFSKGEPALFTGQEVSPPDKDGRGTEVMVFLGLISALFMVFIGFQITYLFGGEANIVNAGFTFAEYARRGFWELLAVSAMSLLILLASEKYSGSEAKRSKQFLMPAFILMAGVALVIISAFKRLSLYVDAYGMTIQRFYGAALIILMLALFVLLAVKFVKSKEEKFFAFGTLLSITALFGAMNIINPDAFIIRFNMERYNRTGKIDVPYLKELSADAMQWKIELYNKLEGEDKELLKGLLQNEKENLKKNSAHWQSANLSRSRALELLNGLKEL